MALVRCRCGKLCLGVVDTYSSHGVGSRKCFGGYQGRAGRSEVQLELLGQLVRGVRVA
jgi:hypothetical protein